MNRDNKTNQPSNKPDEKQIRKKREIKEGGGSAGETMYPTEFGNICAGITGTNAKKDINLEKQGTGEE